MAMPSWHYVPGTFTFDMQGVRREFERISQATYGSAPYVQLIPAAVAPAKPRDGMVAFADGTNWNPGGTGAGVYVYASSAWIKL